MYRYTLILTGIFASMMFEIGCEKATDNGPASSGGSPTVADPKEVALDPQNFVGKTLESKLRFNGFSTAGGLAFKDPDTDGEVFRLKSPNQAMTERVQKASWAAGEYGSIVVTYKLNSDPKTEKWIGVIEDVRMK
jgi:hypothetical protein